MFFILERLPHAKLLNTLLNSDHGSNILGAAVKYHFCHALSILAHVLSVFDPLYVVPFHQTNAVSIVNIALCVVAELVTKSALAYIVFRLGQL